MKLTTLVFPVVMIRWMRAHLLPAYVARRSLIRGEGRRAGLIFFALGVYDVLHAFGSSTLCGLENDQQVLYHNANIEMPALTDAAPGADRDIAGWFCGTRKQPGPRDATDLPIALLEISEPLVSPSAWRAPLPREPELPLGG